MVIRNGGSKNSTSPPYLVKSERSLRSIKILGGAKKVPHYSFIGQYKMHFTALTTVW